MNNTTLVLLGAGGVVGALLYWKTRNLKLALDPSGSLIFWTSPSAFYVFTRLPLFDYDDRLETLWTSLDALVNEEFVRMEPEDFGHDG